MSSIEKNAELNLSLKGIQQTIRTTMWTLYRTSRTENCSKVGEFKIQADALRIPLKENSIFTLTTLK
jgi:hypothetical protein